MVLSKRRFIILASAGFVGLTACQSPPAAPAPAKPAPATTQPPAAPAAAPAGSPSPAASPAAGAAKPADQTAAAKPAAGPPLAAPAANAKRGGKLRIAVSAEWKTLDPPLYTNVTERQIFYAIYNPLVSMDENFNIVPELARSWQVSADALTWTFALAPNVKFHDGTPFNAQAAKFNLDRLLNPQTGSALRQQLADIQEVQAADELTLKIVLKKPFTPLLAWLTEGPGFMSSPTAVQKWGQDYGQHPVGTGPFEFVEWVKGDKISLKKYAGYWEPGLPLVDEAEYRPIPDESVKVSTLRAGNLDIIDDVPARDQPALRSNADFKLFEMKGTRWPMVRMNLSMAPLDNRAVRQALSLAIDREAIAKAIYFGNAQPAYGPLSPVYSAMFDPTIEQFGFKRDVAKAKQKLAEGGQPNGFTTPIEIAGTPEQTRLAEVIKSQLAEIGVNVEITSYEGTVFQDRLTNKKYSLAIGSWTPRPDPDGTMFGHFHSSGNVNSMSYKNPQVDTLLDQTRQLPPGEARVKAFRDAQKLIVDDAPWIFLVFQNQARTTLKAVEDLPILPDTMMRPKTVWLNK
ncbi:MAG: ABC transporter substrate-binding protein [Chloroflexota bacterium]